MSTSYLYRVWLVVPAARQAGLNQFIREEFDNADWLLVPLSASGEEPATHFACCFSCTHDQTSTWAERLTTDGGVPLPTGFGSYTPDQRIAFMEAAYAQLKQLTGVIVRTCRNDAMPWALDIGTILAAESLKVMVQDA
jgi:hypothetical protein